MRKFIVISIVLLMIAGFAITSSAQDVSIGIVKTASTTAAAPGVEVTYTYTVTNVGEDTLYDVSLVDNVVGFITLTGLTDGNLAQGASATGSAEYTIPEDALEYLCNIATVEGIYEGNSVSADSNEVCIHTMGARTIGYWKNHREDWCELPDDSMFFGEDPDTLLTYFPGNGIEEDGVNPLEMLRVQLLAAELNVACFDVDFDYNRYEDCDIFDCIVDAEAFLGDLPDDLNTFWSGLGKAGQREFRKDNADSLALKDVLDTFNNMGDEIFE